MNVVMLGATGATGTEALRVLVTMPEIAKITVLTRRAVTKVQSDKIDENIVDPLDPSTYSHLLTGHDAAISTFGQGSTKGISDEDYTRIDRDSVIDFGKACRAADISHFEVLGSVGANSKSSSRLLRQKGETEEALQALEFKRLSLFRPSNIITPTNRYGIGQAIVLKIWPLLTPILQGPLRPARGIKVDQLGCAFAKNLVTEGKGTEILTWDDFIALQ